MPVTILLFLVPALIPFGDYGSGSPVHHRFAFLVDDMAHAGVTRNHHRTDVMYPDVFCFLRHLHGAVQLHFRIPVVKINPQAPGLMLLHRIGNLDGCKAIDRALVAAPALLIRHVIGNS